MRPRFIRSSLTALVVVGSLSGCGESRLEFESTSPTSTSATAVPETSTTPPVETSTSDYPALADSVCAEVSGGFAEAQAETPRSFEQAEDLMTALAGIAAEGEQVLAGITPPPELEAAYSEYLASRGEVVALIGEGLTAAQDEDGEAYQQALDSVREGARERSQLALAAGLSECAAEERR